MVSILADEAEDLHIDVVDAQTLSCGVGLLVLEAAECLERGMQVEDVILRLKELRKHQLGAFVIRTLEYLRKGGRIGLVEGVVGSLLQIKPVLGFAEDGQLQSVAKVRGRHQVIDKLVELAVKACGDHKRYNLAVANGGAPEEMARVREKLTAALPNYDHIWEGEIDGTLSVYIGDGVLGAAVQALD